VGSNELNFSFNFTSENRNLKRNSIDVGFGHYHFLRVSKGFFFPSDYELTIEVKFEGGVNC
jgi:hypothetical protein